MVSQIFTRVANSFLAVKTTLYQVTTVIQRLYHDKYAPRQLATTYSFAFVEVTVVERSLNGLPDLLFEPTYCELSF
jgi:hypothetical protein